ncbi:DMT family transporter [Paenibacillus sp. HJGM_3]|uniref:DMT family transporter n=1 Tax=Paenibacillus sp. HJGM_3 TaxID=3379816 RepID=UPI00385D0DA3
MAWASLILAGLCEVFGVSMMNRWVRDRRWTTMMLLAGGFALSFFCLSVAMKELPMGTAYAIWTGIGTAGGTLLGMWVYGESRNWKRVLFIVLILGSAVVLKAIA